MTIKSITIWNDNIVTLEAVCDNCGRENHHNITGATKKSKKNITIDFSKLGKRCCDNHKLPCLADYELYN